MSQGLDDLRRRLAPDRRCFAFFHPALPARPLIFVKSRWVQGWQGHGRPRGVAPEYGVKEAARRKLRAADTAISMASANGQDGRRGRSGQGPESSKGARSGSGGAARESRRHPGAGAGRPARAQAAAAGGSDPARGAQATRRRA